MHTALQETWPEKLLWCSLFDNERISGASSLSQGTEQLLTQLATDLGKTGLPVQQQHWVLFSVLGAYMICIRLLRADITAGDGEIDAVPMRLRQVLHQTLQVCPTCLGHRHMWSANCCQCRLCCHSCEKCQYDEVCNSLVTALHLGQCRAVLTLGMPGQCFYAVTDNPCHATILLNTLSCNAARKGSVCVAQQYGSWLHSSHW